MYIAAWLLLVLLGIIFPKSKYISYLQMIFLIVKMGVVTGTADYENYRNIYNAIISGESNIWSGIWLFNLFYYILGKYTSYQFVVFMTALVGMLLVYNSIKHYTDKSALVLSMYMIAPFTIDATQQRNFLAMCVWLWFARYLYQAYVDKYNRKKNLIYYLIGVVLASSIHASFWVTFFFIFIVWIRDKKLLIGGIIFFAVTAIGMLNVFEVVVNWISKSNNVFAVGIYEKYIAYSISYDSGATKLRIELSIVFLTLSLAMFLFAKCKKTTNALTYIMDLNLVFLYIVPLMFFSMEFYRIQRNLLVLDYCFLSKVICNNFSLKRGAVKDYFIVSSMLIMALFYLLVDSVFWNFDSVFKPLLF